MLAGYFRQVVADAASANTKELADIMVSVTPLSILPTPRRILRIINMLLQPAGEVLISFGPNLVSPIWRVIYSPFSQWAPLIFSEGPYRLAIHF
jgi:hypothetical protein